MSSLSADVFTQVGVFINTYGELFAVPIAVCAVGLVLAVVIDAIRTRS